MEAASAEFLKGWEYMRAARRLETSAIRESHQTAVTLFGLAHEFRGRGNALMQSGEGEQISSPSSFGEAGSDRRR